MTGPLDCQLDDTSSPGYSTTLTVPASSSKSVDYTVTLLNSENNVILPSTVTLDCKIHGQEVSGSGDVTPAQCPIIPHGFTAKQACSGVITETAFDFTMTITVTNTEAAPLYDCEVTDPLASGPTPSIAKLDGQHSDTITYTVTLDTPNPDARDISVTCKDSGNNDHSAEAPGQKCPITIDPYIATQTCSALSDAESFEANGKGFNYKATVKVVNPLSGPLTCDVSDPQGNKGQGFLQPITVPTNSDASVDYTVTLPDSEPTVTLPATLTITCDIHGISVDGSSAVTPGECPPIMHKITAV
jgi:hypothetical protein